MICNIAFLCAYTVLAHGADLHVAPDGADSNDGSEAHPLASLEGARDAIRSLKKSGEIPVGGIVVTIREGVYWLSQPLVLSAEDSGAQNAEIVYRAVGAVRIHAGIRVKPDEFKTVTESAVIERLDPAAKGHVLQLDLKTRPLRHTGPYAKEFSDGGNIVELYCNDQRMPLSRWPNQGSTTMAKVLDKGDWSNGPARHGGTFVYRDDRAARWHADGGVWLEGYWRVPWEPHTLQVKSIDSARKTITLVESPGGGIGSKYGGPEGDGKEPWAAVNLIEEIDQPGEWCVDFKSKMLYFWPPTEINFAKSNIYLADMDSAMVTLKNVSHVSLSGFVLEGGLGNGVEIDGGAGDLVAGCTFRNLGGTGAIIHGGTGNGVRSCEFFSLGQGGVYLSGGDCKTLTPGGNFVDNNHFYNLGIRKKTYAPAIKLGAYGTGDSVGNRATHNLMHDLPHAAVLYGGNDNLLEFNEVYSVALTSGDVGAFYTWHDWSSRGNIIRYNFVHDSPRCNAFYMDDGNSGDTVFGNVVYRTIYGPFIGGGHDNLVQNNLMIECEHAIHMDARGVARGYATDKGLINRLQAIKYNSPPWSEKYPALAKILEFHPGLPTGNVITTNVFVRCKQTLHLSGRKDELQYSTIGENLDLADVDPVFADRAHLDFTLKSDSPAFSRLPAFKAIPFDKIGLYRDEFRHEVSARNAVVQSNGKGAFDSNTDVQQSNKR